MQKAGKNTDISRDDENSINISTKKGGGGDKTFLTLGKPEDAQSFSLHDLLFPAGKVAKLCKVFDERATTNKVRDIIERFGFNEPTPVIYMAGAKDSNRAKFYAGICRAAFRVDACVLDSGIKSGIEQFALRRKIKLAGVFPEPETRLPKINPSEREWNELSNGHTHLFMMCNSQKYYINFKGSEPTSYSYKWGDEAGLKMAIANQIAIGASKNKGVKCKIVTVVMGDLEKCTQDIILSIKNKLPVVVVPGSPLSDTIISHVKELRGESGAKNGEEGDEDSGYKGKGNLSLSEELKEALGSENAHLYLMEDNNSEDIAAILHFLLTVTPY